MREGVCTLQEGIYGSEVSLFEMASHNLSSVFAKFLSLCLGCLGRPGPARRARIHSGSAPKLLVSPSGMVETPRLQAKRGSW